MECKRMMVSNNAMAIYNWNISRMECKNIPWHSLVNTYNHWNISRMECKNSCIIPRYAVAGVLEYIQNGM